IRDFRVAQPLRLLLPFVSASVSIALRRLPGSDQRPVFSVERVGGRQGHLWHATSFPLYIVVRLPTGVSPNHLQAVLISNPSVPYAGRQDQHVPSLEPEQ